LRHNGFHISSPTHERSAAANTDLGASPEEARHAAKQSANPERELVPRTGYELFGGWEIIIVASWRPHTGSSDGSPSSSDLLQVDRSAEAMRSPGAWCSGPPKSDQTDLPRSKQAFQFSQLAWIKLARSCPGGSHLERRSAGPRSELSQCEKTLGAEAYRLGTLQLSLRLV